MTRPAPRPSLPDDGLVEMFRQMVRVRRFEEHIHRLFLEGLVPGTTHLAVGQEAIAAGMAAALRSDDPLFCTYRGHHHLIARGAPPSELMAEICGRRLGICKGKGGSMHLTSVAHGCFGSYAIVGAHVPIAAGAGYAAQVRGLDYVAASVFGDGATNIGAFHEGINLAAVWKLPVLFVCENNLYAEYSPASSQSLEEHPAAARAEANGVPAVVVDGNDVIAVFEATSSAATRARNGGGPTVIECMTYRHHGHSRADPGKYRPEEEVNHWLSRDPLPAYAGRLQEWNAAEAGALEVIDKEAIAEMDSAEAATKASGLPESEHLLTDVWANEETKWRN